MRIALVAAALLANAATAWGDAPSPYAQPDPVGDAVVGFVTRPLRGGVSFPFDWSLGVEARSIGHDGTSLNGAMALSASGEIGIEAKYGLYSSYARTGGVLRAQTEAGLDPIGLEHWAAARPWEVGMFRFELDHKLTLQGRPSLSRRPDLWRRSFTREHIGVEFTGIHRRGNRWGFEIMRIGEGFDFTWQQDGQLDGRRFGTSSDWSFFGITRQGSDDSEMRIELMSLEGEAIDGTPSGVTVNTMYVRATDVPLGPLPIKIDGAIGRGGTGYTSLSSGDNTVVIETEGLPLVSDIPIWRARMHGTIAGVEASVGASRSLFLTYDVSLAMEKRGEAELAITRGKSRLAVTGFAARTRLWTDETTSHIELTGGGELRYQRMLRRGWSLDLSGQAARSFYADLTADRGPRASRATRVELALSKSLRGGRDLRKPR